MTLPELAALRLRSNASSMERLSLSSSSTDVHSISVIDRTKSVLDYDILKLLGSGNFGKVQACCLQISVLPNNHRFY